MSDHYRGTVNLAFQKASEVDLTLIMYYAPWDAESQAARPEFEAAALFLHEEVCDDMMILKPYKRSM